MKMTKESLLKIISAADEVISALAGTNDEVHKDDNDKMIRLWDDLNDRYAPPEVVRELARMALGAMDSEPVAYTDERNLVYIDRGRETAYLWGKQNSEAGDVPLYRHAQPTPERDQVRREHADLSEWADMQFLLWDAQRRAGITDEQITQAMTEKLAVNKQREWPEPKDGEPRLHIKEQPAPVVPPEQHWEELCRQHPDMSIGDAIIRAAWWNHCRTAMLQAAPVCTCPSGDGSLRWPCPVHTGNSPVIPDGLIAAVNRLLDNDGSRGCYSAIRCHDARAEVERLLAAAPQEVK